MGNLCLSQSDSSDLINFNSNDPEFIIQNHFEKAKVFKKNDELDSAINELYKAEKIAQSLNDEKLLADVLYKLGSYKSSASLYAESIKYYQDAVLIYAETFDTAGLAGGYNRLGVSYKHMGQYSNAINSLTKSYNYYHALKDTAGQGSTKINLGNVFKNIGEPEKAITYYHEALAIFIPANNQNAVANCYNNLGNVYKNLEQFDSSMFYMNKTLNIRKSTGNQAGLSYIFHNLANLHIKMEDYNTALQYADSSLTLKTERNDEFGIAGELEIFSRIYFKLGDWRNAILYGEKGLAMIKPYKDIEYEKEFYITLAESHLQIGNYKESANYYKLHIDGEKFLKKLNPKNTLEYELIEFELLSDSIQKEQLKLKKELQETINKNEELRNTVFKRNIYLIISGLIIFSVIISLFLFAYRRRLIKSKKEKQNLEKSSVPKEEKEILLKEVHHRVKNNFQIINSLIRIQSEFMNQSNFKQKLIEIENRIRSMSLIHEKLYKSDNISKLDFKEYVEELIGHIKGSYETQTDIEIKLKVQQVKYGIDTLIPLGLILNECISNSLKHSFEGLEKGSIIVELNEIENGTILLIQDDGIGADLSIDELKEESLGMELVWDLTEQLDGTVSLSTEKGFHYQFNFPALK